MTNCNSACVGFNQTQDGLHMVQRLGGSGCQEAVGILRSMDWVARGLTSGASVDLGASLMASPKRSLTPT